MSSPARPDPSLAARYGTPPPGRRRLLVAGSTALALVFLAMIGWFVVVYSDPAVQSDVEAWEIVDEHQVRATVVVTMADDAEDVSCLLRATAEDKNTVGELAWDTGPGDPARQVKTIRTERRATSVDLIGCTAKGQNRPR
ncbi:DUF4307 domain-containing protein [Nocardioides ferulae]|uniref:DUF4307 domain-containing protein n=1 Tax=Nocardioides ferulae TaxID=2340821 RepID=UPI000EAD8B1A|nr:DUF4307 domain-containing protein [Nocardioides ferulae]